MWQNFWKSVLGKEYAIPFLIKKSTYHVGTFHRFCDKFKNTRVVHFFALFWPEKVVVYVQEYYNFVLYSDQTNSTFLWTFLWIEILSKNEIEIFLTFLKCKLSLMRVKKRFKTCSQMRFLEHMKISWVGILLKIEIDIFSHFFNVF